MATLLWQSADQRVRKEIIKRGRVSETPLDGSRVYLTIECCLINGKANIDAKQQWNSEILNGDIKKIFIIGELSSVLDRQIEKGLQRMTIKEKSLITVLYASDPKDFSVGAQTTIKFEVTLNKMDLYTTGLKWESADKEVRKEIIKYGEFPRTPTQGATVHLIIEHCIINGRADIDAKQQWNSKILDGDTKKTFTIGESSCVLDYQIEKALQTMTLREKSLITVLHGREPIDFLINAPATIKFEVTLNKIDLHNTILHWQSADEKVRKDVVIRGESSETPLDGSRVYLTMGICSVNGETEINPKLEWNSEILDGVTNKIFIIGQTSCELDQQIEKALQTMTVKEKSLITILHASNPKDFLKGRPATIKFKVTLDMMDLQTTGLQWQSADQRIRKEIIKCGEDPKTPTQGSIIYLTIEYCIINGSTNNIAKQQWNTKIVDGGTRKSFIIGEFSCVLDQQIETALKTMRVKEKSLITVLHGSDPIDFIIGAPATIKFVVTLDKIEQYNNILQWQSADKKVRKEIIKRGESSETPLKGSRVYLTIGTCYVNGETDITPSPGFEWKSKILDDVTNKICIIGESSCVLDQQIEKALQTMKVKEKSLITVLHAGNPDGFLKGEQATIKFKVTLDMMDLQTTGLQWQSAADQRIRKEIIKCGEDPKTPTQGSIIYFTIEYCTINGSTNYIAKQPWDTKIVDGDTKKSFIIGESSCELDQQIETALKTMRVKEKSLITVLHGSDPIDFIIGDLATYKLVVTLDKIEQYNNILQWQSADQKVRKEIIKRGESSETPLKGSRVYLTIGTCYVNGETDIFSSFEWKSKILDDVTNKICIIGESSCVLDQQIEKALQTMKVKEKSLITVLHAGNPKGVLGGVQATLKFEVTLDMMDLHATGIQWDSANQRVRKEIIKFGDSSKRPSNGSTVYLTIDYCIINGSTTNNAKQQWNTKIVDGDTKKSFIIGESSCVLDQQIETALETMGVKEKSLITVLHGSDPIDFIIGAPATIKFVVTLDKIDELNNVPLWQSTDQRVQKQIIKCGKSSKRPTEGSTVYLTIENCTINGTTDIDARQQWNSEILDGGSTKSFIIGESSCVLDQQIEKALTTMRVKEKSLITVLHGSDPIDFIIGAPATIKFEVTLNKMDLHKRVWEWTPEEKYEVALKYKEIGVRLYKDKRDVDSFLKFSRACKILITMEPIVDLELEENLKEQINNLRLILYNNMASCQLNRNNFEHAVTLCNKVLEKNEKNIKALYRRGIAYGALDDVEHAVADLKLVLTLEPQNSAAKTKYMKYHAKAQEAKQKSVDMVKRMFKL